MPKPDVPHAVVEQIAENYRDLMMLKGKQAATQAKLIRGCIQAIKQTTEQASRALERERRGLSGTKSIVRMHEPAKKVREDRELAFLHLEWLATKLEDEGAVKE